MTTPEAAVPTLTTTGPGVFAVTGPVTFATAGVLLEAGRARFAGQSAVADVARVRVRNVGGQSVVAVNLKDVSRVDSAGLALLLEWLREARTDRRTMTFTVLPDKLLAIARLSGVDGLLTDGYSGPASGSTPSASSSSASSSSASSR